MTCAPRPAYCLNKYRHPVAQAAVASIGSVWCRNSGKLDVGCLLSASAAIVLDIEENRGPLAHLADARSLERRDVNEDVLRIAFGRDEAIALGGVEELDGAFLLRHERYPFPLAACQ